MRQSIFPGRVIFYAGDLITFRLEGAGDRIGRAVLRTNLGRAVVHRRELVALTETGTARPELDWHDIEMIPADDGAYTLTLPLLEVGVFEAKCCFITPEQVEWPPGGNFRVKVGPAANVAANGIYSAFVRQFGENCGKAHSDPLPRAVDELSRENYTVIPPSGTFRSLGRKIDFIFDELGCSILQLLPIHPMPTQYGRMGLYGSPFAALDYFSVDSALADFDPKATPMEQFGELVDKVHSRSGRIFMDIPVNHTGWASKLQLEHPDYFVRKKDGTFESPGAWGVVWEDLCKLDYAQEKVHLLMAKVFLFWCRRGVDGFRCDAGYMLPKAAWDYIVAKVRSEYPETVFLLEGLGGPLALQDELLGKTGLNWGYSELFQNYTRDEISRTFEYVSRCSRNSGTLINFAETHDNNRLAASGRPYAELRFMVCAMLSEGGAFGFANGAEFFAEEKIDVHGNSALNWGAEPNLVERIRKINTLLADHPAFHAHATVELIQQGPGNVLAIRRAAPGGQKILALLNLDCDRENMVCWHKALFPDSGTELFTGETVHFGSENDCASFLLPPGGTFCVGFDGYRIPGRTTGEPPRVTAQRAEAAAFSLLCRFNAPCPAGAGKEFLTSPEGFVARAAGEKLPHLTHYRIGRDAHRCVMIPPEDILLVESAERFHATVFHGQQAVATGCSLPAADGRFILPLILPGNDSAHSRQLELKTASFAESGKTRRESGELIQLPSPARVKIGFSASCTDICGRELHSFGSNDRGGYSFFRAAWGELASKYEAILAMNPSASVPVDRIVMLTRLRGWLVVNGYSQALDCHSIENFIALPCNGARWCFAIPAGQGVRAYLAVDFHMAEEGDAVRFRFSRSRNTGEPGELDDATPVKLILRPDIEDRINHQLTKAYAGAEKHYPASVRVHADGFDFAPAERTLSLRTGNCRFQLETEWKYMTDLPFERYYGLEDKTDLFSPGYFEIILTGGESATLTAVATCPATEKLKVRFPEEADYAHELSPEAFAECSLRRFVVKRDALSTVMAGYPWFLDWGRDTLIVLRGLVRCGFQEQTRSIIREFAAFERTGTIPNMIRGNDDGNRDTSDAPLYLIVATRDYVDATGDQSILEADCKGRRLIEVLHSIASFYRNGTPNGIRMDEKSGLIFSPSHFTWMDTNFPAGTPRQGYPIEIQALWYASLVFLGEKELAAKVQAGIETLFFRHEGICSDCLHAAPGTPAAEAVADDHIRSNALLAITLGAVKDRAKQEIIFAASEELLIPGAIRTLADRPVSFRLPVERDGHLLNDPGRPYQGHYRGPEDTARKVAYHNGTAWCWPFPAYCEAMVMLGGKTMKKRAMALLLSMKDYFENGVPGQLPEVADGDRPHRAGGCLAQAWSVSEFFRVYRLLK